MDFELFLNSIDHYRGCSLRSTPRLKASILSGYKLIVVFTEKCRLKGDEKKAGH